MNSCLGLILLCGCVQWNTRSELELLSLTELLFHALTLTQSCVIYACMVCSSFVTSGWTSWFFNMKWRTKETFSCLLTMAMTITTTTIMTMTIWKDKIRQKTCCDWQPFLCGFLHLFFSLKLFAFAAFIWMGKTNITGQTEIFRPTFVIFHKILQPLRMKNMTNYICFCKSGFAAG